ncbi:unnamed protein product [Pocillopora meandrina]|uniref:G-protein coupled receptors family 2 profile 2 domain-containing protein n=1 Tax=Pocillopora meandrina TaxID=46732 RepID=A0AAU9XU76_9CNID|nr:unnamed protein product [Pocillopora meandrina]
MDMKGILRSNSEIWMNNSCVTCSCSNGNISCTVNNISTAYGMFTVKTSSTCERCSTLSITQKALTACEAYQRGNLFKCKEGNIFIRDTHRCNGVHECPDASDETGCDNVLCKDEEGDTYLIKSNEGWRASSCLLCQCRKGMLECRKRLEINFPGYFIHLSVHEEICTQPSCNIKKFLSKKDECKGVELIENAGIAFKGRSWRHGNCSFYFPGVMDTRDVCPPMSRPICYVYNGNICCAKHCPGLQEIANHIRGNPTLCPNGRQLTSADSFCRDPNNCSRNFDLKNCSSDVTCRDEDFNHYFEGSTWRVGDCMQCACNQGKIHCSRKLRLAPFSKFGYEDVLKYIETDNCNQTECNVAKFMKKKHRVCSACTWNGKLYYDGDRWKENGVDFYCSSASQKGRPGCYVEAGRVNCTGAISGSFSQKCLRDSYVINWIWTSCQCEKKALAEVLQHKMSSANETNFTAVLKEVVQFAEEGNYTNPKVFHDHLKDLFHSTTKLLTPLTQENADLALQYCQVKMQTVKTLTIYNTQRRVTALFGPVTQRVIPDQLVLIINAVLYSPVYDQDPVFCRLVKNNERDRLIMKAFEFLSQAPQNTTAYQFGLRGLFSLFRVSQIILFSALSNFDPSSPVIRRLKTDLKVKVSSIPQAGTNVDNPVQTKTGNINNNTKQENAASSDTSNITNTPGNSDVTGQAREETGIENCSAVTFHEEKMIFTYTPPTSKEIIKHYEIQSRMELVLMCISMAAVVLALVLLTYLRIRTTEKIFIHKNLLLSLGLGNLVFVLDKTLFVTRNEHSALCSTVAVVQFFLHIALFTWMLVEGMNLYSKLIVVFNTPRRYVTYLAIGWGIPAVLVGLIAAVRPSTFDMGSALYVDIQCGSLSLQAEIERTRCWLNGSLWIYKGPVLAILVINLIMFVILVRVIFGKISTRFGKDRLNVAKRSAKSIFVLLPLLGVTWIVGFCVEFHYVLGYVFLCLNSTQGIMFFIFHCVCDDQVRYLFTYLFINLPS